jgi:hypothetical protein
MEHLMFFFNSVLLGVGLAMDAFSVSMANGLNEPKMGKAAKCVRIAGTFLQDFKRIHADARLDMCPYYCGYISKLLKNSFHGSRLALLLVFIGGKMLFEGIKKQGNSDVTGKKQSRLRHADDTGNCNIHRRTFRRDSRFRNYGYSLWRLAASLIIAAVTYVICDRRSCYRKKIRHKVVKQGRNFRWSYFDRYRT